MLRRSRPRAGNRRGHQRNGLGGTIPSAVALLAGPTPTAPPPPPPPPPPPTPPPRAPPTPRATSPPPSVRPSPNQREPATQPRWKLRIRGAGANVGHANLRPKPAENREERPQVRGGGARARAGGGGRRPGGGRALRGGRRRRGRDRKSVV